MRQHILRLSPGDVANIRIALSEMADGATLEEHETAWDETLKNVEAEMNTERCIPLDSAIHIFESGWQAAKRFYQEGEEE